MKNRKKPRRLSRLERIERKCDIILSELLVWRQSQKQNDIDMMIDRLHVAAMKMRVAAKRESDNIKRSL